MSCMAMPAQVKSRRTVFASTTAGPRMALCAAVQATDSQHRSKALDSMMRIACSPRVRSSARPTPHKLASTYRIQAPAASSASYATCKGMQPTFIQKAAPCACCALTACRNIAPACHAQRLQLIPQSRLLSLLPVLIHSRTAAAVDLARQHACTSTCQSCAAARSLT